MNDGATPLAEPSAVAVGSPLLLRVVDLLQTSVPAGRLGVAFSGGVDSAVVLALAVRALGSDRVVALLGVSPSLAEAERRGAHRVAADLGAAVEEIATRELDRPEYVRNGPDRCLHCKDELFTRIDEDVAGRLGLSAVAYGQNADDATRPDRPGALAAQQHGVLAPLAEVGATKAEVRALARELGLSVAEKPAAPCLASRIPHHTPVTELALSRVGAAEAELRSLGFADCRVRHHGDVARIELDVADLARATSPGMPEQIVAGVRAAGYRFVTLDLSGLQSGAFTMDLLAARHDG